ncbi:MAG: DUF1353 domain-containing protein [Paracoccaceae bacterium]
MSSFTTPLRVEVLSKESAGRTTARLLESFAYYDEAGNTYWVPEGAETDFASVPRIFWGIAPPFGRYAKAAVLHDDMCRDPRGLSRRQVDDMFYDAMLVLKVNSVLAWSMWAGVRIGVHVRNLFSHFTQGSVR